MINGEVQPYLGELRMTEHIVVFVTTAGSEDAERIARALLEARQAACCNIIAGVRSLYHWQEKIADDQEVLLVIKSRAELFEQIKGTVTALHRYAVPEIIALPITAGSENYLKWINESVAF